MGVLAAEGRIAPWGPHVGPPTPQAAQIETRAAGRGAGHNRDQIVDKSYAGDWGVGVGCWVGAGFLRLIFSAPV